MDNDPKHTSESTTHFMQINNINHFPTPVSKLVFFNIEDKNINHYHSGALLLLEWIMSLKFS